MDWTIEQDGVTVETGIADWKTARARAIECGGFVRRPDGALIEPVRRVVIHRPRIEEIIQTD